MEREEEKKKVQKGNHTTTSLYNTNICCFALCIQDFVTIQKENLRFIFFLVLILYSDDKTTKI